jgi:UDP-glucose 4-epimerase
VSGRAVVLGGTGFIGGALATKLAAEGLDVQACGSADVDLRGPDVEHKLGRRLGPGTALVVSAAVTPPRGATLEGFEENVAMLGNVSRAVAAAPPDLVVYLSSDAVYGWQDEPLTEDTPVAPSGWYAVGKHAGELMMETVCGDAGAALLVLRPVAVFGPGDTHDAYGPNRFARLLKERRPVTLFGGGEETRDHIYIDDVAGLAAALIRLRATGVFNLATGTSRTFTSVLDDLCGLVASAPRVESASRAGPITHRSFDIARLRRAVPDFRFTPFDRALEATLADA